MNQKETILNDWAELKAEFTRFQDNHKEYVKKLDEVESLKKSNLQKFEKYKKRLVEMKKDFSPLEANTAEELKLVREEIDADLNYMNQISDTFPRKNGLYLRIILGGVNVSILNKEEKLDFIQRRKPK